MGTITLKIAMVFISPLLLIQAVLVRRNTPKLPEPEGARSGCSGQGKTLDLWIVGDSAAAGVGVDEQKHALSGRLVDYLSRHYKVNWRCIASSGYTISSLIQRLEQVPPEQTDVIVVSIGVNDVVKLTSGARWLAHVVKLERLCRERFKAKHVVLSAIPPMQAFPAIPQPLAGVLGARAKMLNRLSSSLCDPGVIEWVDFSMPLTPVLMASDGFHPGFEGYKHWAHVLGEVVQTRLRGKS